MLTATLRSNIARYCSTVDHDPRQRRVAVQAGVQLDESKEVLPCPERCVGVAVNADQLRRDALVHFRLVPGLRQYDEAGVGVHVDEAGAHDPARRVDCARRLNVRDVAAEQAQRVALDAHRAVEALAAGAVDDHAAGDEQVEHKCPSPVSVDSPRLRAGRASNCDSTSCGRAYPDRRLLKREGTFWKRPVRTFGPSLAVPRITHILI